MLETLQFENIKGRSGSYNLGHITAFTGDHRSGKSAAMDAARLATTQKCSNGSSVEKKRALTSGVASARAIGSGWTLMWSLGSKQESLCLKVGTVSNHLCNSGLPTSIEELWGMTGAEKWKFVESIVGSFNEEPPPSTEDLEAKIDAIKSVSSLSRGYTGHSSTFLEAKISEIRLYLDEQERLGKNLAYRRQRTEQARERIPQLEKLLEEKQAAVARLDSEWAMFASKIDACKEAIEKIKAKKGVMRRWGGTPRSAIDAITLELEQFEEEMVSRVPAALFDRLFWINQTAISKLEKLEPGCFEVLITDDVSSFNEICGTEFTTILECEEELRKVVNGHLHVVKDASKLRDVIAATVAEIDKIRSEAAFDESEFDKVDAPATIAAKSAELTGLIAQKEKALDFENWISGSVERGEKIVQLEAEIAKRKEATKQYATRRADYLHKAGVAVCGTANAILEDLGFPGVNLNIQLKGSRSTIDITNTDGIGIDTMAGSEKVIYGSAVLFSLLQASSAEIPLMFIEMAEVNRELSESFMRALSDQFARGARGNVFLAHWSELHEGPNCVVHDLNRISCMPT